MTETRIEQLEKEIRELYIPIHHGETDDMQGIYLLKAELKGRKEERQATAREIINKFEMELSNWEYWSDIKLIIKRIGGLE